MCDGSVAIVSVQVLGYGKEHFANQAAGVIDIWKQGCEDGNAQVPGTGKDIHVPEGTEDSGEDEAADYVVWSGHGNWLIW